MRRFTILALILLFAPAFLLVEAQTPEKPKEKPKDKNEVKMPENVKKATARALTWLATKQNTDGSFSDSRYPHNPAITSFALLAFLSQGHLPNQGTYGKNISKASRYLISCARQDGYMVGTRGGNMYAHGMATLAMAEMWGLTNDKEIKLVLTKAVDLIVKAQAREGGWRYSPRPSGSDISVTIMQVMALRAAKNAGVHFKDEVIEKAIGYIWRCYDERTGGFSYMPGTGAGMSRTAAGVCVLYLTGEAQTKDNEKIQKLDRSVRYLKDRFDTHEHYWYGHYYAAHAMHQVGGEDWKNWYDQMARTWLPLQRADGSITGHDRYAVGAVYETSIAVIGLSVPMHCLPIYQR